MMWRKEAFRPTLFTDQLDPSFGWNRAHQDFISAENLPTATGPIRIPNSRPQNVIYVEYIWDTDSGIHSQYLGKNAPGRIATYGTLLSSEYNVHNNGTVTIRNGASTS